MGRYLKKAIRFGIYAVFIGITTFILFPLAKSGLGESHTLLIPEASADVPDNNPPPDSGGGGGDGGGDCDGDGGDCG